MDKKNPQFSEMEQVPSHLLSCSPLLFFFVSTAWLPGTDLLLSRYPLLLLGSDCYHSPLADTNFNEKLITRIWCYWLVKDNFYLISLNIGSLPVCLTMYGYHPKKLHIDVILQSLRVNFLQQKIIVIKKILYILCRLFHLVQKCPT